MEGYGSQSMVGTVKRMLLKHPHKAFVSQEIVDGQWEDLFYLGKPDYKKALREYEKFVDILSRFGMEIAFLPRDEETSLDSMYTHDPLIVANGGAILGNMGKAARASEPEAAGKFLEMVGVPTLGRITGKGRMEGGDVLWVDGKTLAVGQGYRTNGEGIRQLSEILGDGVEIVPVALPHWTGPNDCLHLMSFISLVDYDLAVVHSRLMPVPFREWLLERGFSFVEVPDEEYDSFACNVLAVAPRKCVMLAGNPKTQRRLEEAGAEVYVFEGKEICLKGTGGPTCLTRPVWRE
ncbi:MAG: arginine deiminase family protein [Chloroflexia bacterium]